jgi:hypothetical protein
MHRCVMCQRVKSHQLPLPKSISVSKVPLELVFYDVWVTLLFLLDDSSIMCRLLMITTSLHGSILSNIRLKFFTSFMISNKLLKDVLIRKFLLCRQTREVSIKILTLFFQQMGIAHHVSCPL